MEGTNWSAGKRILWATIIAGALDISWAIGWTVQSGKSAAAMLRGLASGPFPDAAKWDLTIAAATGLAVHFAIMAVMAAVFVLIHDRVAAVRRNVIPAALAYGVVLWLVMYGLVLPMRFGAPFPTGNSVELVKQLFAHIVLAGLPIGLIARKG